MRKIPLISLLLFFTACSSVQVDNKDIGNGDSNLCVHVYRNDSVNIIPIFSRGEDTNLLSGFNLRIENTKQEVLKNWSINEVPELIKVVPGSYKLVAWKGSMENYPIFDQPFYEGETKVTLKEGESLDTIVNCKLKSAMISVKFDETFDYDFQDYSVDVKTVGDSLHFTNQETRIGYFKPGRLRMRFVLTPRGKDESYLFYPSAMGVIDANSHYKFTLSAQSSNGALSGIILSTDTSVDTFPVTETLSPILLPKKAPIMKLEGMENNALITTSEGLAQHSVVMINASAGLKSLYMKTSSYLQTLGLPDSCDLMNLSVNDATVLKQLGLEKSAILSEEELVRGYVFVRFDSLIANLPVSEQTNNRFEVWGVDKFNQTSERCKFTIKVNNPDFSFTVTPSNANMWAHFGKFRINYKTTRKDYIPTMEYKTATGEWKLVKPEEVKHLNNTDGISICKLTALNANTAYTVRAKLGGHYSDEYTLTTEQEVQIPNSNFEDYYSVENKKYGITGQPYYTFYPYTKDSSNKWWETTNLTTTQKKADASWYYGLYSGVVPTKYSDKTAGNHLNKYGNLNIICPGENGSNAMEISTVGWGKNNWTDLGHKVAIKTAGELYIGSYDATNHVPKYGHVFSVRPMKLKFKYSYYSYNNEKGYASIEVKDKSGKVIASGILKIDDTKVKGYSVLQQGEIALNYIDDAPQAATISVVFKSSASENPETKDYQGGKGAFSGYYDSRHIGSVLTVDSIELLY